LDNLLAMQRAANQKGKTDYFPKLLSTHNTEAFNRNFIFHVIELLGNRGTRIPRRGTVLFGLPEQLAWLFSESY
jgi:hypothetical protein